MIAIFKGFISVEKNAVFAVERTYNGAVIGEKHFELKDGVNADCFIIGNKYPIDGLTK